MDNIVILINNDAGLYRFRKELLVEFSKHYRVHVACPFGSFYNELARIGCIIHNVDIDRRGTSIINDAKLIKSYFDLIKQIHPKFVLSYTIKPNIYGGIVCGLFRIPYFPTITGLGTAVTKGDYISKLTIKLYRISLKRASCVFFQNSSNLNYMINKRIVNGNYVLVSGSGVNLEEHKVSPYPVDDNVVFLFISRVMKEKGIEQYIEAATAIKNLYPNTRFYICGRSDESYSTILKDKEEEGIIEYFGFVKNIQDYIDIAACVVHPSYYPEGMSNVLLEASATGRPIITTNLPGCGEIVEDGVNGFIVKERDSSDLIQKIELFLQLSNAEKTNMGLAGRTKVENEFNRETVVKRYIEVINNEL